MSRSDEDEVVVIRGDVDRVSFGQPTEDVRVEGDISETHVFDETPKFDDEDGSKLPEEGVKQREAALDAIQRMKNYLDSELERKRRECQQNYSSPNALDKKKAGRVQVEEMINYFETLIEDKGLEDVVDE